MRNILKMRNILALVSLLMVFAGLGCAALSHYVTPAEIDQGAVTYAVEAGVAEPNDYDGYGNIVKSEKLCEDVDNAHLLNQEKLVQAIERDTTQYGIHTKTTSKNYKAAIQREEVLFGEKGLLSLGLSMAGFGTLTGLIGLARKRPQDVTPQELEQAVSQATGKTTEELSAKQKQFIQLVKGVQAFMDTHRETTNNSTAVIVKEFKQILNTTQDADTQVAVTAAKKAMV